MASIDVKTAIAGFKTLPTALKVLLGIVALDLVLLGSVYMALSDTLDDRVSQVAQLKNQQVELRRQISAARTEASQIPQLRQHYDAALAEGLLSLKDRGKLSDTAKDLATRYHLTSFSGRFEPETFDPVKGADLTTGSTRVEFLADAMVDTDLVQFWGDLLGQLPAHYRIQQATLEREGDKIDRIELNGIRSGRLTKTVEAKLIFNWVGLAATTPSTPAQTAAATPPRPGAPR